MREIAYPPNLDEIKAIIAGWGPETVAQKVVDVNGVTWWVTHEGLHEDLASEFAYR
jgi:hypothetical protein